MSQGSRQSLVVRCPRCGNRVVWDQAPNRPFCSERCRLADLGQWLEEDYRISSPLEDESEGSQESEDS